MSSIPPPGQQATRGAWTRPREWVLVALVIVLHLFPLVTGQPTREEEHAWMSFASTLLAFGQGLPLLWRRSHPRAVTVCVQLAYAGTAAVVGLVPPVASWVVLWSTASRREEHPRSDRVAAATAASTVVLVAAAEFARPGSGASLLLVLITFVVMLAAVLLRTERRRVAEARERAAAEERLRIARDMHDLVGHGLSVIAVQSSTARMALEQGHIETARAAVSAVESSSRTAMQEMRQMLGVLMDAGKEQEPKPPDRPSPGIADITEMVENLAATGTPVTATIAGDVDRLPNAVQLTAYRVVQESLTNSIKHSPGAPIAVHVQAEGEVLGVTVESTGGAVDPGAGDSGGIGLSSLRARVEAMDGEFRAGATPDGWRVAVRLTAAPEEGS